MVEIDVRGDPEAVFPGLALCFYIVSGYCENCYIAKGAVEAAVIGGVAAFGGFGACVLLVAAGVGGLGCRGFRSHARCDYDPRGHCAFRPVEQDAEG